MTSNPLHEIGQFYELAHKKLGNWPFEEPVQTIKKNVRQIQSLVSSHQQNQQIFVSKFK
jgi:hypothetical protein